MRGIAGDWRVAAGVEDDEIAASAGGAHFGDDLLGVEEFGFREHAQRQVIRRLGLIAGLDRDEVVRARDGDAVAGVVEQGDFRALDVRAESGDGFQQFVARDVVFLGHGETETAQGFGDRLGIVDGIAERADGGLVFRVADDERDAGFGRRFRAMRKPAPIRRWRKSRIEGGWP